MNKISDIRILGAGGHAKVAAEAWRSASKSVLSMHDDDPTAHGQTRVGVVVLGDLATAIHSDDLLHIAIGDNAARRRIAEGIEDGRCPPVVHIGSVVSTTADVASGALVCAGAVVQAEARIGRHCIVNTSAVVEHDVEVCDFAHIAPGVRLAGGVVVGEGTLIGVGAIVLPGLKIGANVVIGAGTVVMHDVRDATRIAGNPARPI